MRCLVRNALTSERANVTALSLERWEETKKVAFPLLQYLPCTVMLCGKAILASVIHSPEGVLHKSESACKENTRILKTVCGKLPSVFQKSLL